MKACPLDGARLRRAAAAVTSVTFLFVGTTGAISLLTAPASSASALASPQFEVGCHYGLGPAVTCTTPTPISRL
ncbi:MAG: hypothetical protein ACRDWE_09115 [Acidimicrobiales bacterium]